MSPEAIICMFIFVITAIVITSTFVTYFCIITKKGLNKKVIQRKPNSLSPVSKNDDQNHLNKMISLLRKVLIEGIENKSIIVGNSEYISINSELDLYTKKRDELKNTNNINAISTTEQLIK
jgi:hypothetical protein